MEILLAGGRFDPERLGGRDDHAHGDASVEFDTWSFETDRAFSVEALSEMIRRELPASVYRCKGVVYAAEEPDHRVILQVVGRCSNVSLADEWGVRAPSTKIVAIGAYGSVDNEALTELFEACINDKVKHPQY